MASRFSFPVAYDPQIHREESLTLARTTSEQYALLRERTNDNNKTSTNIRPTMSPSTPTAVADKSPKPAKHRNFVFADPVAFRFIEDDPATVVIDRYLRLPGYELYIVEQWVCSRAHPTFVIATYTGDTNHSISVGVLGIPANTEDWSPRLQMYFKASSEFQARPKDTPMGQLLVTNLSNFPSALTVISVPDGDVRKYRENFIVNENLKRLGCSGRSGMSLSPPTGATQAKFSQLYRTSDRIPIENAVLELVKLCQVALIVFGKLEVEYLDGLLCDMMEKAISDWWADIGLDFYNTEPTDGILGPTTVAALLGTLIGARNRLNYLNAPVGKDAFDVPNLKRGIAYFQKNQKMTKTRLLDRQTLNRLHNATAKAAAGEGWAVPKAVKSTVAELSGKGGEMVRGMVGRDKAGIGEIETLDMDRFVSSVHGERAKWLWLGKPRKSGHQQDGTDTDVAMLGVKDDQGGYIWSHNRNDKAQSPEELNDTRKRESPSDIYSAQPAGSASNMLESPFEKDTQLRKQVIKSVTGKMSDATSRFGRIKDAVGLRGHASKHSKDEGSDIDGRGLGSHNPMSTTTLASSAPQSPEQGMGNRAFTWKNTPSDYHNGSPKLRQRVPHGVSTTFRSSESPAEKSTPSLSNDLSQEEAAHKSIEAEAQWNEQVKNIRQTLVATIPSVGGSVPGDADLEGPILEATRDPKSHQLFLRRRHSISGIAHTPEARCSDSRWPRQLSFSDAEEAVLGWEPVTALHAEPEEQDSWVALQRQKYMSEYFKHFFEKVTELNDHIGPWVEDKVDDVDDIEDQAGRDQESFQTLYATLNEQYRHSKHNAQEILGEERSNMTEMVKDVEILGAKLEYEISSLLSKVKDVEEGVKQFENAVIDLETTANSLEEHLAVETWAHWAVRTITGIGTPPNRLHTPQTPTSN